MVRDSDGMVSSPERLQAFFDGARREINQAEQEDRKVAIGFNVFDLIKPDENKLSDIFKLLLDPRGVHGQGDLFLRLLIKSLDTGWDKTQTHRAIVRREAPTKRIANVRRRIDLLIEAGDVVGIENKVNAPEQPNQIRDYLEYLGHHARDCKANSTLIYLTLDGRRPDSISREEAEREITHKRLRCWSYGGQLRLWLEACREQCEAQRIRSLLTDLIEFIMREYVSQDVARCGSQNNEYKSN